MRTPLPTLLTALLLTSGCATGVSGVPFFDDEDDEDEDAFVDDDLPPVTITLAPDFLLLEPGEARNIEILGGQVVDADSTLDHVDARIHGDHVRVTNEGTTNASGRVNVTVEPFDGDGLVEVFTRVTTWDGNAGSLFNELDLRVTRGRLDTEPAELVAYRDSSGYHARSGSNGLYEIPLDVSLPFVDVTILCEVPTAFGLEIEHIVLSVPTDDDEAIGVECVSNIETHTVSGAFLNVTPGDTARAYSFESTSPGSAVYSLSGVPANGDSEIVAWSSATMLPEEFVYLPLGPAATVENIDFATASPATIHTIALTGSGTVTGTVTLRTDLFTTVPVSATIGTAFQFASTDTVPGTPAYGLEARNTIGDAYSARVKVTSLPAAMGDVALPDPDAGLAPIVTTGPVITFQDGGDEHYVELTDGSIFPDTRVVRFFSVNGASTFSYPDVLAGLQTLPQWDAAWELSGAGTFEAERIDLSTCSDGWISIVSHPEVQGLCTVDRLGWTGFF